MKKIIILLLIILLSFPQTIKAEENKAGVLTRQSDNSLTYSEETVSSSTRKKAKKLNSSYHADSFIEMCDIIRSNMVKRETSMTFNTSFKSTDDIKFLTNLIGNETMKHTGQPYEGDYLFWNFHSFEVLKQSDYVITINIEYYTNYDDELALQEKMSQVLQNLNLTGTNRQKIKTIHDYICKNVSYDYEYDENNYYVYTAYNALMTGKAVCQGYATLFYSMCLSAGIDCRVISGKTLSGVPHGWNLVKDGKYYYYVDTTWDADLQSYQYFMKNSFSDHINDPYYETSYFRSLYPTYVEKDEVALVKKKIVSISNDKDVSNSIYQKLKLRQSKVTSKSITIKWNKITGATYEIYASKCGKPYKLIKITTSTSYKHTTLKKNTFYKYIVIAKKKKKVLSISKSIHINTNKKKNIKKLKIKTSKTVKLHKTYNIKTTIKPQIKTHISLRYESSNSKVASVSKKGKVKAKIKGTVLIYVYSQNGLYKTCKITVK